MCFYPEQATINWSLENTRERRKLEGGVLAQGIADKLNDLSLEERQKWIMTILGYLAEATNIAYRKGVEAETMMIPSEN